MSSLMEQYAIEVNKIDSAICNKLKEALHINLGEVDTEGLDDKDVEQLHSKLADRRDAIISLFRGNFAENQNKIREQIEAQHLQKRRKGVNRYTKLANKVLKERVDSALDEIIKAKDCSALEASVGIDRKTFIDAVLEENVEIDLDKNKEAEQEESSDR